MKLKNIKDSFENRKITPSSNAWEQLAARLDEEDKKSTKRPMIYWLGAVAAAVIALVMVYPFMTSDSFQSSGNPAVEIVDTKTEEPKEINTTNLPVLNTVPDETINAVATKEIIEENEFVNPVKTESINSNSKKEESVYKTAVASTTQNAPVIKTTNENIDQSNILQETKRKTKQTFIDDNTINPELNNAVAYENKQTLTAEQEMELLLNDAIKTTSLNGVASKNIDTAQLLREAEWDVEADRRNKINNAIYDQLGKLKSEAFALIGGK